MAWRPTRYLIKGELENTERRKVTGWVEFLGLESRVTINLDGEFHRDIRGAAIHFYGDSRDNAELVEAGRYFNGFASHQTGKVGDITAGLPPRDYSDYPYIEWYSDQNGRVVLELDPEQLEVIGTPIPACESDRSPRRSSTTTWRSFCARCATSFARNRIQTTNVGSRPRSGQEISRPMNE